MATPSLTAIDIQSHLYSSFLQGRTADVALRVTGTWRAVYNLHRVILIQSDFFRSLFTSGFRETSHDSGQRRRGAEEIDIRFDDTNITRAAFEVCLARLYGGGPPLYLPPSLLPSTSQPLSPSFTVGILPETVPDLHHPATPRFLLSLLATSIYLSIPTVASQALSMIFKTIGPYTITPYLNFALGKSIDHGPRLWNDPEAGVGLENVAELLDSDDTSTHGFANDSISRASNFDKITLSEYDTISGTSDLSGYDLDESFSSHHYGPISDKIGEACSCWLVRWATDMLALEKESEPALNPVHLNRKPGNALEVVSLTGPLIWGRGGLDAAWVSSFISSDSFFVKNERARYEFARSVVVLRRKGGVIAAEEKEWIKLFENGIYYASMPVEDIISVSRDVSPVTNTPYVAMSVLQTALWSQSLLRHHIAYRPPSSPGQTASPPPRDKELGLTITTQELQAQQSSQDDLNHQYYYPVVGDSSLRLGDNGGELAPQDGTSISMEDLFQISHSPVTSLARQSINKAGAANNIHVENSVKITASEETVFGLKAERYTSQQCIAADPTGKRRWTPFPPQRFGVEFWDIDALKEKSRLHSHTIWHAGSLFNVYIQIVKKKGQAQLGIYLHRQSSVEPVPSFSAPAPSFSSTRTTSESEDSPVPVNDPLPPTTARPRGHSVLGPMFSGMSISPSSPTLHSSRSLNALGRVQGASSSSASPPSSPSLSSTPNSIGPGAHSSTTVTIPFTTSGVAPIQPYRDPRSSVSAYFSINCASATGSSQMRFTSRPDVFSVSQSWGWKTSTLRTEEYMEAHAEGSSDSIVRNPIKSLRATIILGIT